MTYRGVAVAAGAEQPAPTAATLEKGLTHKIPDTPYKIRKMHFAFRKRMSPDLLIS
jgi:hypothetical protein